MNKYPIWKYGVTLLIVLFGIILALPNIYGKDPALQISARSAATLDELTELRIEAALDEGNIKMKSITLDQNRISVRFDDAETQLRARTVISQSLGGDYIVALNLVPAMPAWLEKIGVEPMFLGLDLRGGVHFLMEVDMSAAIVKAEERFISDIRVFLRKERIRYKTISRQKDGGILIRFRNSSAREKGMDMLADEFRDLTISAADTTTALAVKIKEEVIHTTRMFALQQNITTLRKRVNELGVAEPVIQQQGLERIVVQLPGVQDTARAKEILGATATLEFRMVDDEHDIQDAVNGRVPAGASLYKHRNGQDILLKKRIILTGDYIIDAASGIDPLNGRPEVMITLDGKGAHIFSRATRDEVGKRMAVVFIDSKFNFVEKDGKMIRTKEKREEVINAATIQEQLGKRFRITGLDSTKEARNLALLLRAGALAAPIDIIEERTVGPSLGQDNIKRGFNAVVIGFIAVLFFMVLYYKLFGLIANIALTLNLVLIVAMLSLLQATLTLPGIAGIVLTVGIAVDANVLIFERIREEIRNGNSPQTSIFAGYQKAFSTIADANITTFIAALVLFTFGTGPIKGFAVTLSLGIISSIFTAIMVTRALVNLLYGGRSFNTLRI